MAVATDEYAEEELRVMKSWAWWLVVVSVLTEGFQVAAGRRQLFRSGR
ncbi:hypothetical protein ACFVMS_004452 [Salmonella enterica]